MASLRINHNQENRLRPTANGKEAGNEAAGRRPVLGAIENRAGALRPKTQPLNALKSHRPDEKILPKAFATNQAKSKQQVPPAATSLPVAQFQAFKVYEEDVEIQSVAINVFEGSKAATCRQPLKDVEVTETPESRLQDSPMSVRSIKTDSETKASKTQQLDLNKHDVFDVVLYRNDIYAYLRETEVRYRPRPEYMKKQKDISYSMRTILVDWLVEVAEEYKLHTETLFLAVSFIDRFLSYFSVVRASLQLVGTAAIFIASKYEEIYPPDIGEFVYITDDTYTKKQVMRMEQLILKVLEFNVSGPTPLTFIRYLCKANCYSDKITFLATYISELSMLEADPYLQFTPSQIAAASVALARYTINEETWPQELEDSSWYSFRSVKKCFDCLQRTFRNAASLPQQAIQEKYKSSRYLHVSSILAREEKEDGTNGQVESED